MTMAELDEKRLKRYEVFGARCPRHGQLFRKCQACEVEETDIELAIVQAENAELKREHIWLQRQLNIETDGIDTYKDPPLHMQERT